MCTGVQLLGQRRRVLNSKLELLSAGISQLEAAATQVKLLQQELHKLTPVLQEKHARAETLLKVKLRV